MAFCVNCGQQLDDGAQFCSACGAQQGAAPAAPAAPAADPLKGVKDFFTKLLDTPDYTAAYDAADIQGQNTKLMAILAYLGWLVLVPLFLAKQSRFARFHVNQGILLAIAGTAYSIVTGLISGLIGAIVSVLGAILGWIFSVGGLVFTALMILGIVNAATGKAKELPIIGKYRILD